MWKIFYFGRSEIVGANSFRTWIEDTLHDLVMPCTVNLRWFIWNIVFSPLKKIEWTVISHSWLFGGPLVMRFSPKVIMNEKIRTVPRLVLNSHLTGWHQETFRNPSHSHSDFFRQIVKANIQILDINKTCVHTRSEALGGKNSASSSATKTIPGPGLRGIAGKSSNLAEPWPGLKTNWCQERCGELANMPMKTINQPCSRAWQCRRQCQCRQAEPQPMVYWRFCPLSHTRPSPPTMRQTCCSTLAKYFEPSWTCESTYPGSKMWQIVNVKAKSESGPPPHF